GEKEARDGEGGAACVATPRRRRCWGCFGVCRHRQTWWRREERHGQRREGVFREEKEVLPAPPFIPVISRACRRCVFKERVSLEELPSAISSLTHLTDIANLFSLQARLLTFYYFASFSLHTYHISDPTIKWSSTINFRFVKGTGLSAKECEIYDFFVYIPQYGGGTASLNVTVAASIVLHHFGVWAGFGERSRDGNKFVVAERP
ncbi:hypothetical protein S83_059731, partial [Arachis hypogaea]